MNLNREPTPAATGLTHAVDILAFVEAQEIPTHYFETPYYLAPAPGGEKDYALLRETLRRTRKIGIAYVVIQARQHLAALIPHGQSLVLNTLRWCRESGGEYGAEYGGEYYGSYRAEHGAQHDNAALLADKGIAMRAAGAPAAGPVRIDAAAPVQRMRVTGCDDLESEFLEELLEESLFDSDDMLDMFLRPRLHASVPRAGRGGTTVRQPRGASRPRRLVRRA